MLTPLALLMHRDIQVISPKATLRDAARKLRDKNIGSLLVGEGEAKVGIVSEGDLTRCMAEGLHADEVSVESVMSSPIISIDLDRTAQDANDLMAEKGIRHLAISDRDEIVGIISVRDLLICFKNRI